MENLFNKSFSVVNKTPIALLSCSMQNSVHKQLKDHYVLVVLLILEGKFKIPS